jgi:hypothetical protein
VHAFLFVGDVENCRLPWDSMTDTRRLLDREARVEAIEEHLGVFPDGTFVPLTLRQRLFFGSAMAKLVYKIDKVRMKSREIVEMIESQEQGDDELKDILLIREFILECLSPFKRYTLKANNEAYSHIVTKRIPWSGYLISWFFVTGCLLFFIYWIFAWGVYQGSAILSAWGAIFGTGAASDILLVQVTKIFILYYLPASAMQPQLLRIRSVLADISMNYINRSDGNPDQRDDITVVQHISAACKAARSNELIKLPSAWLLRQVLLGYISIICIIIIIPFYSFLINLNIFVHQMDDVDTRKCRDGRLNYLGSISFLLIAIPMTCILLNEAIGDAVLDAVIPAVYSGVLSAGAFIYSRSIPALIAIILSVIFLLNYWRLIYLPASRAHAKRMEEMKKVSVLGPSPWRRSRRRFDASKAACLSLYEYFKRVYNILKLNMQHGITLLSCQDTSRTNRIRIMRVWGGMNTSSAHMVITASEVSGTNSPRSPPKKDKGREITKRHSVAARKTKEFLFPEGIINVMCASTKWKRHYISTQREISLSAEPNTQPLALLSKNKPERALRKAVNVAVIFTAQEALSLLRARLCEVMCVDKNNKGFLEVTERNLFEEFKYVLEIFHPDGIALSSAEKTEACDQYHEWKETQNEHFQVVCVDQSYEVVRMINFPAFERWFLQDILSIIQNTVTDRLMYNSLRHVPNMIKRLSPNNSPTNSSKVSANNSANNSAKLEHRRNMRGLNVVTADQLTARAKASHDMASL